MATCRDFQLFSDPFRSFWIWSTHNIRYVNIVYSLPERALTEILLFISMYFNGSKRYKEIKFSVEPNLHSWNVSIIRSNIDDSIKYLDWEKLFSIYGEMNKNDGDRGLMCRVRKAQRCAKLMVNSVASNRDRSGFLWFSIVISFMVIMKIGLDILFILILFSIICNSMFR